MTKGTVYIKFAQCATKSYLWSDTMTCRQIKYHSTISGSIFAHISKLTKTVSSLHSSKNLLMFHTSCKTMNNVLSYTNNLVWGLGWFVCTGGIVRRVILEEGYCKRDSHQISDLPEVGISAILSSLFLFLVLFQSDNFIYGNNHNNKDWSKVTL